MPLIGLPSKNLNQEHGSGKKSHQLHLYQMCCYTKKKQPKTATMRRKSCHHEFSDLLITDEEESLQSSSVASSSVASSSVVSSSVPQG